MAMGENAMPEIRNYMEACVKDVLVQVLSDLGVCTCPRCRYDISALALNTLPPKYVVTRKGQMYTKLSSLQQQFTVDIITAITHAAETVSQRPRHDLSEDSEMEDFAGFPEFAAFADEPATDADTYERGTTI